MLFIKQSASNIIGINCFLTKLIKIEGKFPLINNEMFYFNCNPNKSHIHQHQWDGKSYYAICWLNGEAIIGIDYH